ncbi:MAG: hypothetical protein HY781_03500, partial [Chloroflexi bacterium]|nr:hypothetical protein [Chloroflexota bacterium]
MKSICGTFSGKTFAWPALVISLAFCVSCTGSAPVPTETPTLQATSTLVPSPTPTMTLPPTATSTPALPSDWVLVESQWLQLYYPSDWALEPPPGEPVCVPGIVDCIVWLSHSPSETVEIQLIRDWPLEESLDLQANDEKDWSLREWGVTMVGAPDLLKLVSVDEIQVDGVEAVRRLYEYPLVDPGTMQVMNIQYNYRVMFLLDGYMYLFRMV